HPPALQLRRLQCPYNHDRCGAVDERVHASLPLLRSMYPSRTKVAVVQLCSGPDVERNLTRIEGLVREAAQDRAELVVLPECASYFGPEEGKPEVAEPLPEGGPVFA